MWNLGTCPDLWYSKGSYSSGLFSYCKLYWYLHDVSSCQRTGSHQTLCFLQHVRRKFLVSLHYNLACHFEFKSIYRSFNFFKKNSGKLIGQKLYTCSQKKREQEYEDVHVDIGILTYSYMYFSSNSVYMYI